MASDPIATAIVAPRPSRAARGRTVVEAARTDRPAGTFRWGQKAVDVVSTLAASFLLVAITVLQAKMLADALGPEGRGEFAAALSYTRLLTYIGLLGTNYVITRRMAQSCSAGGEACRCRRADSRGAVRFRDGAPIAFGRTGWRADRPGHDAGGRRSVAGRLSGR